MNQLVLEAVDSLEGCVQLGFYARKLARDLYQLILEDFPSVPNSTEDRVEMYVALERLGQGVQGLRTILEEVEVLSKNLSLF